MMTTTKKRRKVAHRRQRTSDRDHELHVRCTAANLVRWQRAAASRGLSLSYWVWYELNGAAAEDEARRERRERWRAAMEDGAASAHSGESTTAANGETVDAVVASDTHTGESK